MVVVVVLPIAQWNVLWCFKLDTRDRVSKPTCCTERHRIHLLILLLVGLILLTIADIMTAFMFFVYLTSITGTFDFSAASATGPMWIYLFVMPLVPLWAPFMIFVSAAFRNSRLARYASASALFGCYNVIGTILYSNFMNMYLINEYDSHYVITNL